MKYTNAILERVMDDDDDYLSDKFLAAAAETTSSKPLTYAERRKEAQRKAAIKNEQNKRKSRRQLQEEALEKGLQKSLFERAKEEQEELGTENKAMSMMMKMGFKPGQSLGKKEDLDGVAAGSDEPSKSPAFVNTPSPPITEATSATVASKDLSPELQHRKVPLSIDIWFGELPAFHSITLPPSFVVVACGAPLIVVDRQFARHPSLFFCVATLRELRCSFALIPIPI